MRDDDEACFACWWPLEKWLLPDRQLDRKKLLIDETAALLFLDIIAPRKIKVGRKPSDYVPTVLMHSLQLPERFIVRDLQKWFGIPRTKCYTTANKLAKYGVFKLEKYEFASWMEELSEQPLFRLRQHLGIKLTGMGRGTRKVYSVDWTKPLEIFTEKISQMDREILIQANKERSKLNDSFTKILNAISKSLAVE